MYAKIAPIVAMTAVNMAIWLIMPLPSFVRGVLRGVLEFVVVRAVHVKSVLRTYRVSSFWLFIRDEDEVEAVRIVALTLRFNPVEAQRSGAKTCRLRNRASSSVTSAVSARQRGLRENARRR